MQKVFDACIVTDALSSILKYFGSHTGLCLVSCSAHGYVYIVRRKETHGASWVSGMATAMEMDDSNSGPNISILELTRDTLRAVPVVVEVVDSTIVRDAWRVSQTETKSD